MGKVGRLLGFLALFVTGAVSAERAPVLGQIDLPHPYYYREMYLPQLTPGPSSLCWLNKDTLVYSMAGSLWRQTLGNDSAEQLTAGEGYDYEPDCSPDGRFIIYSTYRADAVELSLLDVASGQSRELTNNGGINIDARFSPDGRRIVFVSTQYHRRFHLFVADMNGEFSNLKRLTGENKSSLPRYYYSPFDHEITPVWSRDGKDILYVSNRNHIYGTGGLWRVSAAGGMAPGAPEVGAAGAELHYEETNWKARPDVSPDGSRLVYASYLGRSWHNLWLLPAGGGDPFPLTYGDFDQTNPRWSPDGTRVAFISNREGGTEIGLIAVPGGHPEYLVPAARHFKSPMARLHLVIRSHGAPAVARVSVRDAKGHAYAPAGAWLSADDGHDAKLTPFEAHYFHLKGDAWVDVPPGMVKIDVMHGFERKFEQRELEASAATPAELQVNLDEGTFSVPAAGRWGSADVHVHMNYGGVYRNTPAHLLLQAQGENLNFVNSLIVNKEQRFPDITYNGVGRDPVSTDDTLIVHAQEYHTSYWGHLGLLNIKDGIVLPGYVGYPNTAAASLMPMNADVADIAHARGAVVGYVHPFDEYPEPIAKPKEELTSELPVDVILGKVDYMEILGFSDHRSTAHVWYQLLNLGFKIPAAGGTDAMANYASLRGPVGMNRVFVKIPDGPIAADSFLSSLKAGRSFATNGPLLGFELQGLSLGDELKIPARKNVAFKVALRSLVAVDHLDLVCNGKLMKSFIAKGTSADHGDFTGSVPLTDSGWCVVRASSDQFRYPVLDNYVYATTSPIYVSIAGRAAHSSADAKYFAAWIDRMLESTSAYPDWNSPAEKSLVLRRLNDAKARFSALE
ncbi:MAG TPA: CehA/McbA family metallohydrolase [Steroidobacteraceae bacterium]|jgi:Tol biopolymer transport system component